MDNKKMYRQISVLGLERGDMVYYIAQVLASAQKKVLILDNSSKNDLHNSITVNYEDKSFGALSLINTVKNSLPGDDICNHYDYVINYVGNSKSLERKSLVSASNYAYVITSQNKLEVMEISETLSYYKLDLEDMKVNLIIMDKNEKISDKLILEELGLDSSDVTEIYDISPDESMQTARTNFSRFGKQSVKGVSAECREVLLSFYNIFFPSFEKKQLERAKKDLLSGKVSA